MQFPVDIPEEFVWLWKRMLPLLRWHATSFLCIMTGSLLGLLGPLILRTLIDQILPQRNLHTLLAAVGLLFFSYVGRSVLNSCGSYCTLTAAQRIGLRLRMSVLQHLDKLSASYYGGTTPGAALYPLTEPIDEIAYWGTDLLPALLRIASMALCMTAVMLSISPALTLAVLPLALVFLIVRRQFQQRFTANSNAMQRMRTAWSSFLQEHIAAIVPIQLLGMEHRQEHTAHQKLSSVIDSQQRLFYSSAQFTFFTSLGIAISIASVIGFGGWRVISQTLTIGSLVAFYGFVTQLFETLGDATQLYARTQKSLASVRQVGRVLALRPDITNAADATVITEQHSPQLEIQSVTFSYEPQRDVLQVPSLQIAAGEFIAITGDNGSGKSTLAKLIARLYDPIEGTIRIGRLDLRAIELKSLRRFVGYLPSEPTLFDGSLADNLCNAEDDASPRSLQQALRCVELEAFVAALPLGMEQAIGAAGCLLSDGQRQRLALARALLRQPRILILDEATCCLDAQSELRVLQNIRHHLPETTLILVTHRRTAIQACNRILVFAGGRIVTDGKSQSTM